MNSFTESVIYCCRRLFFYKMLFTNSICFLSCKTRTHYNLFSFCCKHLHVTKHILELIPNLDGFIQIKYPQCLLSVLYISIMPFYEIKIMEKKLRTHFFEFTTLIFLYCFAATVASLSTEQNYSVLLHVALDQRIEYELTLLFHPANHTIM